MEPIRKIAAALPPGKYFDLLFQKALHPWSEALGAELVQVNLGAENLGALCNALEQADLVVVDLSGRHARVLYAAGYAHGIGKKVLFISQFADDFPFALSNQRVVTYSGSAEFLLAELQSLNPGEKPAPAAEGAREKFLGLFGEILREHRHEHRGPIEMENPGTFVLLDQDMDLPLVQALSRKARELGVRLKLM